MHYPNNSDEFFNKKKCEKKEKADSSVPFPANYTEQLLLFAFLISIIRFHRAINQLIVNE